MQKVKEFLNRYILNQPGIQYNLFFVLYSAIYVKLLSGYVFNNAASFAFHNQGGVSIGFGLILLFAFIFELFGIIIKSKEIKNALYIVGGKKDTPLKSGGGLIIIAAFHLVNSFLIGNLMANAFGISYSANQIVYILILVIIFIRELYIWQRVFLYLESNPEEDFKPPNKKLIFLSNSFLVIYGLIAYTAIWEVFGNLFSNYFSRTDIFYKPEGYFQFFFVIIGVLIMSFIFYLPTRFGFLIDEQCSIHDNTDRKVKKYTMWLAVIMAIFPYVVL